MKKYANSDSLKDMILFLLTLLPLLMAAILLAHEPKGPGVKKFLENVIWGIRSFVVALVLYIILFLFVEKSYTLVGIYFYYVLHDYLFWGALCLGGYLLLYRRISRPLNLGVQELFPFALGFFLLTGVVDGVVLYGELNVYNLFLMPLVRVGIMAGAVYIVALGRARGGRFMIAAPIIALLLFFLGGGPALLFSIGYPILAVAAALVLTAGGIVPYLIHRMKRESLLFS